jgi:hypothetical protein
VIIAQYEQTIASDVLATHPHETKKREQLYATLWGARGLLEFMKLNAAAAANIKAEKAPTPEGTTDYYVEPLYDDEGFPRAEDNDY